MNSSQHIFIDISFLSLSLYSLDGHEVGDVKHIENGEKYVAVGYGKGFVKMDYSAESASITPGR